MHKRLTLYILFLLTLLPALCMAKTVYVSTTGLDTNDGLTWATAKKTVQAGLNTAVSGDEVWVAEGVYVENITLNAGIALYGGFIGDETLLNRRDWKANETIIDGNQSGSVVTCAYGLTSSARIDGFTIRNGSPTTSSYIGSGIDCPSSPTIANNIITGNSAGNGGGICVYNLSSPIITNCTMTGNTATNRGGGIYSNANPIITNCLITDNTSSKGGGYACYGSTATIINSTIAGNNATLGGGIYAANSGTLTLHNTAITFNSSGLEIGTSIKVTLMSCWVYGNTDFNFKGMTDPTGTNGNRSEDPLFVNKDTGDYHLQLGSSCIDAGNSFMANMGWKDIDGQDRVYGLGVDIGADECIYPFPQMKIGEAKKKADKQKAAITSAIVTKTFYGYFYIEDTDRSSGLRVNRRDHDISEGDKVRVEGEMLTNNDGERYIRATSIEVIGTGSVKPISMPNRMVGGGSYHFNELTGTGQRGVSSETRLNNIGLLVKVWGKVTAVSPDGGYYYIDDGSRLQDNSGNIGLRVYGIPPTDPHTILTGISCIEKTESGWRPVVRTTDVIAKNEMIHIPAGNFQMGDNTYQSQEYPRHTVYLQDYWIGKYEVTRGEYRKFIDAGGYTNPVYWSNDGWAWKLISERTTPAYWDDYQVWNFYPYNNSTGFMQTEDHPVVGVSYYEAEAYCNWAGGRLPTEAEWEKAARWNGVQPNTYPWGDTWDVEKCNSLNDHNPAGGAYPAFQTAPVGSYPKGSSSYGCHDMAGNTMEWCRDWYISYPGNPNILDYTGVNRSLRDWGILYGQPFPDDWLYRTSRRYSIVPSHWGISESGSFSVIGFRIVRSTP